MALFLISYDLSAPEKNYPKVLARMKEIGATRVLYSQWQYQGEATVDQVFNGITNVFDSDDRVLVTQVSGWWGTNLMKNLPMSW